MRFLAGSYDAASRIDNDERFRHLLQTGACQGFRGQEIFLALLLRKIGDDQTYGLKVVDLEAIKGQKGRHERAVHRLHCDLSPAVIVCPALEKRHKVWQVTWYDKT